VPVTQNGGIWFLHALPQSPRLIEFHGITHPLAVRLLRTGAPLDFTYDGTTLRFEIRPTLRTGLDDVVAVETAPPHPAQVSV
jgi:hypothetical protein